VSREVGKLARNLKTMSLAAVVATLIALPAGTARSAVTSTEVDFSSKLNNIGITQDPTSGANFDGGGFSYSSLALQLGDPTNTEDGIEPGTQIEFEGATLTWPETSSGANDNVAALGQTIPIPETPGATKLVFLGAATNGPSIGNFILNYEYTDETGDHTVAVPTPVKVSDWTLNAGQSQPEPGNTVVASSIFRMSNSLQPERVRTNVFGVTVPLDETKTLVSIKLPLFSAGQIHLFNLAVVGGTDEEG
jgi:hypothetical protein